MSHAPGTIFSKKTTQCGSAEVGSTGGPGSRATSVDIGDFDFAKPGIETEAVSVKWQCPYCPATLVARSAASTKNIWLKHLGKWHQEERPARIVLPEVAVRALGDKKLHAHVRSAVGG